MKRKLLISNKSHLTKSIFILFLFLLLPFKSQALISFPDRIDTLEERINIQKVLNIVMTPSPNLVVDGSLGRKSIQSIKTFQELRGLVPDGMVGLYTRSALEKAQTNISTSTGNTSINISSSLECAYGALFSNLTGKPCKTTISTLPYGCTSSTLFSPLTGISCTKITLPPTIVIIPTIPTIISGGGSSGGGGGGGSSPTTCSGSTTQTCSITNGTGNQTRSCNSGTWSAYGTCTISSCNLGYQISGNSCVAIVVVDTTKPVVTVFAIPGTSTSLTIPITTLTATDNVGVTSYLLTESSTIPLASDSNWTSSIPTSYIFVTAGSKTLYAWAKDAAGNVSNGISKPITITISIRTTATTFYISSSGNDLYDGTSIGTPWKSITKINTQTFLPGDNILFKKGDTFYGSITISQSGTVGKPITFSSYGSGALPVITGFTTVSGWVNEGNGIYSRAIASESSINNIVTVDGVNTPMGRYPDTGYLSYESHSGNTSITDNQLTETINWTGAELVLRRTQWTLNRNLITNHTGSVINYTPAVGTWDGPSDGYGYFIQNDIKTLDNVGDWYYDGATLHMYFGNNNPISFTVKISTLNELITTGIDYKTHFNYITLDNIAFEGSKLAAVYLGQLSSYWTIQNCNFNLNGKDGIYGVQTSFLTISENVFNQINNNAIRTIWLGDNTSIRNNTITNIGVLPGMGGLDDASYDAVSLYARADSNSNSIVEYNTIRNVGHIGMRMNGNGYTISNNTISNFGLVKGDVGGIYTSMANTITISNNIIVNSNHSIEGIDTTSAEWMQGIYIDDYSHDITISGNTIFNIQGDGIGVQSSQNIEVSNNNVYASVYSQLKIASRNASSPISGINIHDNILVAKTAGSTSYPYTPLVSMFITSLGDINTWGLFNNNYYSRPIDDDDVFRRYDYVLPDPWNGTGLTLNQWQTYSGQDINSHKSPKLITDVNDILFDYNPTTTNKIVSLGSLSYVEINGTVHTGSITLLPYTSIVLIKQ